MNRTKFWIKRLFIGSVLIEVFLCSAYYLTHWIVYSFTEGPWKDPHQCTIIFKAKPVLQCRNSVFSSGSLSFKIKLLNIHLSLWPFGLNVKANDVVVNHVKANQASTINMASAEAFVTQSAEQVLIHDFISRRVKTDAHKTQIYIDHLKGDVNFNTKSKHIICDNGVMSHVKLNSSEPFDVSFDLTSHQNTTKINLHFKQINDITDIAEKVGLLKGWAKEAVKIGALLFKDQNKNGITIPIVLTQHGFDIDLPFINFLNTDK